MEQITGGDSDGDQGLTLGDLRRAHAAYQQTTVCSTCGGSGVEKAIAGNGYHWCPDCRRE